MAADGGYGADSKSVGMQIGIDIINLLFKFEENFYNLFTIFSDIYVRLLLLKFPMFCASNLKCPIIKVSYLLWDSYAYCGGDFLLTSDNACAKLSLLQYLSFALAKHSFQVSHTVLLCLFCRFSLTAEYAYAILSTVHDH